MYSAQPFVVARAFVAFEMVALSQGVSKAGMHEAFAELWCQAMAESADDSVAETRTGYWDRNLPWKPHCCSR